MWAVDILLVWRCSGDTGAGEKQFKLQIIESWKKVKKKVAQQIATIVPLFLSNSIEMLKNNVLFLPIFPQPESSPGQEVRLQPLDWK